MAWACPLALSRIDVSRQFIVGKTKRRKASKSVEKRQEECCVYTFCIRPLLLRFLPERLCVLSNPRRQERTKLFTSCVLFGLQPPVRGGSLVSSAAVILGITASLQGVRVKCGRRSCRALLGRRSSFSRAHTCAHVAQPAQPARHVVFAPRPAK